MMKPKEWEKSNEDREIKYDDENSTIKPIVFYTKQKLILKIISELEGTKYSLQRTTEVSSTLGLAGE